MRNLFVSFVLIFIVLNSYCQTQLTNKEKEELNQIRKYEDYIIFCKTHDLQAKDETTWLLDLASQSDYKLRQDIEHLNSALISSGNYLIKARKQILYGFGCQALGGVFLTTSYLATLSDGVSDPTAFGSAMMIASGGLAITGLVLEISGFVNIGKAGIVLNEHGVGVRVKF
jgi:hypothetical protein